MQDLKRIGEITAVLKQTRHKKEAQRLYNVARMNAHKHPRGDLDNIGRRLRKLAKDAGVWYPGLGVDVESKNGE
jgi:hypothetical protein